MDTPAESHRQRALVMLQQDRWDLAEKHLRALLAAEPGDSWAHACLGMSLSNSGKHREAMAEVDRAIESDPQSAFAFYVRAVALSRQDRNKPALQAIEQAIALEPDDADNHATHAALLHDDDKMEAALAAAERALALDADHATALNLRGMILTRLGRFDEAKSAIDSSLRLAPENDAAHTALGQLFLHRGDSNRAIEHFSEALRLDPRDESAKAGFVEAIKAQNRVYRVILWFFLWLGRQRAGVRWGVIIAIILGRRAFQQLAKAYPDLAPLFIPLAVIFGLFFLLTWVADPLFNLLVRFHPLGRHALTSRQKAASNWLAGLFITGLIALLTGLIFREWSKALVAGGAAALLMPIGVALAYEGVARRRRWMVTAALAAVGVAAAVVSAMWLRNPVPGSLLIGTYVIGCLCSPLLRFGGDD